MNLREAYMLLGGDLEATLNRLGDRAVLVRHLRQFPKDEGMERLRAAMAAGDAAAVWQAAHGLRGVGAALGLGRLACAAEGLMRADMAGRATAMTLLEKEYALAVTVIGLLEERDTALAMLVHELRGPLQAILGEAAATGAERIALAARHMSAVLAGMTASSARREAFSLPEVMRDAAALLEGVCAGHAVSVRTKLRHERVLGDPGGVTQALLNLLTNAAQSGPEDGSIALEAVEGDGEVALTVRDNGRGMTETERQHACEPGWRRGSGMGLGLTIVRELTARMGGRMTIESEPGKGTAVTLLLPLPPAEDALPIGKLRRFEGLRALLAEDSRLCAETSAKLLSGLGLRLSVTRNGGEAVRMASEGGYDCAFLDVHMPGMEGSSFFGAIHRALPDMPLFALTAGLLPGEEERLAGAGMRACLLKPVGPEAVSRLLGRFFPEW